MDLKKPFGLYRSLFIYYGMPFRGNRLLRLYRPFISPGDLCFDIGAHVGNRLQAFSRLGARVVALEPQPYMMRFLQQRYGRKKNVSLLQEAAGAQIGQTTMYISKSNPTVTSLSKTWIAAVQRDKSFGGVEWDEALSVHVTTLDHLIRKYGMPSFCKIDVEGYELEVLRGLTQPIPILSYEYIPAAIELARDCITRLSELGNYHFNWSRGESHRMSASTWLTAADMLHILNNRLHDDSSGDIYARLY